MERKSNTLSDLLLYENIRFQRFQVRKLVLLCGLKQWSSLTQTRSVVTACHLTLLCCNGKHGTFSLLENSGFPDTDVLLTSHSLEKCNFSTKEVALRDIQCLKLCAPNGGTTDKKQPQIPSSQVKKTVAADRDDMK